MKLFSRREIYRPSVRPVMLGVVGDSGCGKSTLVGGLRGLFGKNRVLEICLDDYHRYDRAERSARHLTALDPSANNIELMTEHLRALRQGQRILKPVYDHATGRFGSPEALTPRSVIIVHGLFTLFTPALTDLFDLGVYLDPQEALRLEWKVARDTHKRGYQLEEVLRQIEERRQDAALYIQPQKRAADLVISFRRPVSLLGNSAALDVRLSPRSDWHWPHLQPDGLLSRRQSVTAGQPLEIAGRIDPLTAERLARSFVETGQPNPLLPLPANAPLLKKLGYYAHTTGPALEQRQSLTLALTQLLVARRLTPPVEPASLQVA